MATCKHARVFPVRLRVRAKFKLVLSDVLLNFLLLLFGGQQFCNKQTKTAGLYRKRTDQSWFGFLEQLKGVTLNRGSISVMRSRKEKVNSKIATRI